VTDKELSSVLDEIRRQHGDDWPLIQRSIERSIRDVRERGFCLSVGEWRKDINAVGAPIVTPGGHLYALTFGGPAYLVSPDQLEREYGPAIASAAKEISVALGGPRA
jgi:DNA-binding IclR family transcriptional regulator